MACPVGRHPARPHPSVTFAIEDRYILGVEFDGDGEVFGISMGG
jgi:hypothetical protein